MTKHKILPIMATAILAGAMFFVGCEKEKNNVEFNSKPTLAYGYSGSTLTGICFPMTQMSSLILTLHTVIF